tara:strand:+ start:9069 stop:9551 length:483 start_codon:yes stop_codon:yes gene_type:complete
MNKELFKEIYLSFFFLGRAPVAPGTFGTLGGVVLAFLITNYLGNNAGYALLILIPIMYYFGLILAPWAEKKYGGDPGIYVLDEVIGYLIIIASLSLLQFPIENHIWFLSFILFRIFDVVKLWPARNLEKLHGGHGILLDDIAAGFQTLITILLLDNFNLS